MGQAKQRGSLADRKANPNPKPKLREWTKEERAAFNESMKKSLEAMRKSLFSPIKKKVKRFRNIKTGG